MPRPKLGFGAKERRRRSMKFLRMAYGMNNILSFTFRLNRKFLLQVNYYRLIKEGSTMELVTSISLFHESEDLIISHVTHVYCWCVPNLNITTAPVA
jgi:hypothetical protein